MNKYETVFILTPVLSDAQMKETVEKFKTLLKEQGAKIENEELWGLRKLAYPINKKTTGFYVLIEFEAGPEVIKTLEVNFRREERVLRFLILKQDKYAYEYAIKRRKKLSSQKEHAVDDKEKEKEMDMAYKFEGKDADVDFDIEEEEEAITQNINN